MNISPTCCNPLLDCFLCDSRSLLLAVLCLFWPYMGPWGPPLARHPSQPIATLQHYPGQPRMGVLFVFPVPAIGHRIFAWKCTVAITSLSENFG